MRVDTRDPAVIHAAQTLRWISLAQETGRIANLVVFGTLRSIGDAVFPVLAAIASIAPVLGFGLLWLVACWRLQFRPPCSGLAPGRAHRLDT